MTTIHKKHMEFIDAANEAETVREHELLEFKLNGFREALAITGSLGNYLIDADLEQMERGIDRPMCGGLFLDWTPKA